MAFSVKTNFFLIFKSNQIKTIFEIILSGLRKIFFLSDLFKLIKVNY